MPPKVIQWLHSRTLSDETIARFNIHWDGRRIVIPICDADGKHLFNKYRRDPYAEKEIGPKYKYDVGATATLFNESILKEMKDDDLLFITEGELDCIAVENTGIHAVTTTGGAGTFELAWIGKLSRFTNLVVCFDNDMAGMKGAYRVMTVLPNASVIMLPKKYGKDITEFLQKQSKQDLLNLVKEHYNVPNDIGLDTTDKKSLSKKVAEYRDACDAILALKRSMISARKNVELVLVVIEILSDKYEHYRALLKNFGVKKYTGDDDGKLLAARSVPITNYIKFTRGYAPCLWHNEKTASMFYNDADSKYPNTVKCFGCSAMGDTVDVIMKMHSLKLPAAIKFILNS